MSIQTSMKMGRIFTHTYPHIEFKNLDITHKHICISSCKNSIKTRTISDNTHIDRFICNH